MMFKNHYYPVDHYTSWCSSNVGVLPSVLRHANTELENWWKAILCPVYGKIILPVTNNSNLQFSSLTSKTANDLWIGSVDESLNQIRRTATSNAKAWRSSSSNRRSANPTKESEETSWACSIMGPCTLPLEGLRLVAPFQCPKSFVPSSQAMALQGCPCNPQPRQDSNMHLPRCPLWPRPKKIHQRWDEWVICQIYLG